MEKYEAERGLGRLDFVHDVGDREWPIIKMV